MFSWAPAAGRLYQLVATACKDKHVRIFRISNKSTAFFGDLDMMNQDNEDDFNEFQIDLAADLIDHNSEVWKVS